jgi:hypothetical protein
MSEPRIDPEARCDNCHHPYQEHTDRSIGHMDKPAVPGGGCEHRLDFRHTCGCPHWFARSTARPL